MADIIEMPLPSGLVASISANDYERNLFCKYRNGYLFEGRICDLRWVSQKDKDVAGLFYVRASIPKSNGVRVLLHRLVMCAGGSDIVDHIDRNELNNVRTNLRFVSPMQSASNTGSRCGSNSKYKGVHFDKRTQKYVAQICSSGKKYPLGRFATEESAAMAYDAAASGLHGTTAVLNLTATL